MAYSKSPAVVAVAMGSTSDIAMNQKPNWSQRWLSKTSFDSRWFWSSQDNGWLLASLLCRYWGPKHSHSFLEGSFSNMREFFGYCSYLQMLHSMYIRRNFLKEDYRVVSLQSILSYSDRVGVAKRSINRSLLVLLCCIVLSLRCPMGMKFKYFELCERWSKAPKLVWGSWEYQSKVQRNMSQVREQFTKNCF